MTVNKGNDIKEMIDKLFERNPDKVNFPPSITDGLVGCTKNQDLVWDPNWPNTSPGIFPNTTVTTKLTFPKKDEKEVNIPELYDSDLQTLQYVMSTLEDVSRVDGVFSVEIRVKTDDVSSWAVIGWGESGDPCILRFEKDESHGK